MIKLKTVLERVNEKWKNERIRHLFSLSKEMQEFFQKCTITDLANVEHDYEYHDEGYYADQEIIFTNEDDKGEYVLGLEYGRNFHIDNASIDEAFDVSMEEANKIIEFFKKMDFPAFIAEAEVEFMENGKKERETSIGVTVKEIKTDGKDFIYVLSNGRKIRETGLETKTSEY